MHVGPIREMYVSNFSCIGNANIINKKICVNILANALTANGKKSNSVIFVFISNLNDRNAKQALKAYLLIPGIDFAFTTLVLTMKKPTSISASNAHPSDMTLV